MVFIKHNCLKSDIFFNPIFVPGFSGSMLFRVHVIQSPDFSESRFFRVKVFQGSGPGFPGSGSSVRVQVFQALGPGSECSFQKQLYECLLNRSDGISIHQKHLRYLAIEVYKSLTKLNPGFMWNFFERNYIPYNLRRGYLLLLPPAKSTRYGAILQLSGGACYGITFDPR